MRTQKEKPAQFAFEIETMTNVDQAERVVALALEAKHGDIADARGFIERDIERHRTQYADEMDRYHREVQRAKDIHADWKDIKKPRDPAKKIFILNEALAQLSRQ